MTVYSRQHDNYNILSNNVNDFHLHQFVAAPTRFGTSTSSLLELVFNSLPSGIVNVTVGHEFSDHCLVYFDITCPLVTSEEPPRKIYMYGRGNYDQFRIDMANFRHRFFALSADREINDNWSQFKDEIHVAIDKNIPSKVVKSRKRRPQWRLAEGARRSRGDRKKNITGKT